LKSVNLSMILKSLRKKGVYVYHIPIPDSSTPNLIVLHEVIDFISKCEKPVLIHCCGGCGRSGTVVTAYLMSTEGLKYEEALIKARSINPCFVESEEQHRVLRLYDRLLGAVPTVLLSKVIEIGKNFRFGRGVGHVSKVLELSVELVSELEHYNLLSLKTDVERTLYIAAILHDIGVYKGFSSHKVYMS